MRSFKFHIFLFIFSSLLATTASAYAPTLQNTIEQYDPGHIANDLTNEQKIDEEIPSGNVVVINGKPTTVKTANGANIKFLCRQIIVTGNTKIATIQLSKLYQNKINKEISLADLNQIAQGITEYYRNSGYVLSQAIIPPQEITNDGMVKINIVEGHIDKVYIKGCTKFNVCTLLKKYGDHIAQVKPITLDRIERFAFLAHDIPGAKVRVVLTRSPEIPGAADLIFVVEEKTFGGFIAFNDYNSMVLGREQYLANIYVNNLLPASETAINGIVSRYDDRMRFVSFTHRQQLNSNGLGGRIAISYINTDPDMTKIGLGEFIIPGQATIATASIEYAWIKSHSKNLILGGGIKYLNSDTVFGDASLFNDNTRSANIYISYNFLKGTNNFNLLSITYTQGFDAFGAKANPPSRQGEHLNFSKFEIFASNSHKFTKTKFSSYIAMKAQYALNVVPSSETFIFGGIPFGYGYDLAEFAGDRGLAGILELQYPTYSIQCYKLTSLIFGFIDGGYVADINQSVQPTHQAGISTGAGHRIYALKHMHLDFIVAVPLKPTTININDNYVKLLFNIKLTA